MGKHDNNDDKQYQNPFVWRLKDFDFDVTDPNRKFFDRHARIFFQRQAAQDSFPSVHQELLGNVKCKMQKAKN